MEDKQKSKIIIQITKYTYADWKYYREYSLFYRKICNYFACIRNIAIEINAYIFHFIMIMVRICINRYTGHTKEILVFYNENGFNKNNIEFI